MPKALFCPQGHRFEPPGEDQSTVPGEVLVCPVCGLTVDPLSQKETPAEKLSQTSTVPGSPRSEEHTWTQPGTQTLPSGGTAALPQSIPGYDILGMLGRGGMGVVYKARQVSLNRVVALKMLLAGEHASPRLLDRFRSEAEAVAQLHHPNIVQLYEFGKAGELPFFALEYIEGGSLAAKLREGLQPYRDSAQLVTTLARAVHYAHQRGIIHRDLKPANILLQELTTETPRHREDKKDERREMTSTSFSSSRCLRVSVVSCIPKITDFGLAKRLERSDGPTQTGDVLGTPSYMAPEQASGVSRHVGPATDIYALGAILYELLTGQPPFRGPTASDTLVKVLSEDPVPPRRLQRGIPKDLETICLKCLQKKPDHRYRTAEQLADDLERFRAHQPIHARRARPWERVWKWARRRPTTGTLAALFVLLLLLGAGAAFWYWDKNLRVKVEYYASWTKRWGLPEGVGRLSEEQARERFLSFKFSRRAGRVEKVEVVNSAGSPMRYHDTPALLEGLHATMAKRECSYQYTRDEEGNIKEEIAYDAAGSVVWTLHYTTRTTGYYTDAEGLPTSRAPSGASYVRFVWSADGFYQELQFRDANRNPQPNKEGVYGYRFEVDERGLITKLTCLGPKRETVWHRDDFASEALSYNALGQVTRVTYLGMDGQKVLHRDGYGIKVLDYDDHGNLQEMAFRDVDDRPVMNRYGYAAIRERFDAGERRCAVSFHGLDGQLTRYKDGCAQAELGFDEQGNLVDWIARDEKGKRMQLPEGCSRVKYAFDPHGFLTEVAYFGLHDEPVLHRDGYAKVRSHYDSRGNKDEESYFGLDGQLTQGKGGYAQIKMEYDQQDNQVRRTYFDDKGKRTTLPDGIAETRLQYDARGNRMVEEYFDVHGQPVHTIHGVAKVTWEYNNHGLPITQVWYGPNQQVVVHTGFGYARSTWKYDHLGREIERATFDAKGHLIRSKEMACSKQTTTYEADGNRILIEYDEQGKACLRVYVDRDGKQRLNAQGYAVAKLVYQPTGALVGEEYYDVNLKPTLHKDGFAKVRWVLDDDGRRVEEIYLGLDGARCARRDGSYEVQWTYDKSGATRTHYDADKRLLEEAWLDQDGKPRRNQLGVARVVHILGGPLGRRLNVEYFDVDGTKLRMNVVVMEVEKGSLAQGLHLKPGDVLLRWDGKEIVSAIQFVNLRRNQPGAKELEVLRKGERLVLRVPAGELGVKMADRVAPK
jgi:serine/threonine protein kinase